MPVNIEVLMKGMQKVRCLVDSPNTDITWSSYNSVNEFIEHLDALIEKIKRNDQAMINELKLLFAPTGVLQEISINSGWSHEFVRISSMFDDIVGV